MASYTNTDNLQSPSQSSMYRGFFDPSIGASLAATEDPRSGMERMLQAKEQSDIAQELLRQTQLRGKQGNDYQALLNQQLTAQSQGWDSAGQLANINNQNQIALSPGQQETSLANQALQNSPAYRELYNAQQMSELPAKTATNQRILADDNVEMDKPRSITVGGRTMDLGIMSNKEWRELQIEVAKSELSADVKRAIAEERASTVQPKLPTAWIQIRQALGQQYPNLPSETLDKMTNEAATNAQGRQEAVTANTAPQAEAKIKGALQALKPTTTYPNAPPVGTVKGGFTYKGGDPASPTSWSKQ